MKTIIPSGYPTVSLKGLHEFNKTLRSHSLSLLPLYRVPYVLLFPSL